MATNQYRFEYAIIGSYGIIAKLSVQIVIQDKRELNVEIVNELKHCVVCFILRQTYC